MPRVVRVTGASGGIGPAIARRFAADDRAVVHAGRRGDLAGHCGARLHADPRPGARARGDDWPEGVQRWMAKAPLGRLADPEDIAQACAFLACAAARSIHGHGLVVDGGMSATAIY